MLNHLNYDVIVCGAGSAGICAAVAAARNGAKTLLLEHYDDIGGTMVHALVFPAMTFHATVDHQVIKGIPEELVQIAIRHGGCPGHIPDPIGTAATITPIEPTVFRDSMIELLSHPNLTVQTGVTIETVVKNANRVTGLVIKIGNSPKTTLTADVIIDASGDAAIAAFAGAEFTVGREKDHKTQPLSLIFVMQGVDIAKVRDYIRRHPEDFVLSELARTHLNDLPRLAVAGFFSTVKSAQKTDHLVQFRDRVLFFEMATPGEVNINMTRVYANGLDTVDLESAYKAARDQVDECVILLLHHIPGFEYATLKEVANRIGVRETRHIHGDYTLTEYDVVEGKKFADGIACGAFPIDIHSPDGNAMSITHMEPGTYYSIPYRCLLPKGIEGLLVAGRPISATHEAAGSARLSPTCMALGEAAGTAAALSVTHHCLPRELDVEQLRDQLKNQGAVVE